jgi:circadian clock protein KaiB
MPKYSFKLFVTGQNSRAERAIANLQKFCDEELGGDYQLIIVDVLERPHEAEAHRILATPTLIKETPLPVRRIIGDLSDIDSDALE